MATTKRVLWAPRAIQDLQQIRRYYAREVSPEIAERIVKEIDRVTWEIAKRPLARRARDELAPGLRSALARPYTIFFRIRSDDVEIVRVLHERRDFPAAFPESKA